MVALIPRDAAIGALGSSSARNNLWRQDLDQARSACYQRGLRKARLSLRHDSFTVGINRLSIEAIDALDNLGANP